MKIAVVISCLISLLLLRGVNGWPSNTIAQIFQLFGGTRKAPGAASVCKRDYQSKCGRLGGVCIGSGDHCNDYNAIQGLGYCSNSNGRSYKCCLTPTVYMRDIKNAIAYALRNRAPYNFDGPPGTPQLTPTLETPGSYRILDLAQQRALSDFAAALRKYLPLSDHLKIFLECVIQNLGKRPLPGWELEELYLLCEQVTHTKLPNVVGWIGCRNTKEEIQTRSYPCGLWTIFHAITFSPNYRNSLLTPNPNSFLKTILGLVEYFPWCGTCKDNFIKKYKGKTNGIKPAEDMKSVDQVTEWLWLAHNDVTQGNKGNCSNPGRSQFQFPGPMQCPDCRNIGTFNYPRVLEFLRNMYKPSAIVY